MRQGRPEAYDDYLNGFNARLQNMEMAGEEHLLCSPQPTKKILNDAYEDDVNVDTDRFRDMCLFIQPDKTSYV